MLQYVDVVMLTNSGDDLDICKRTIKSLHDSETDYKFNVILVDSGRPSDYRGIVNKYISVNEPFNYNKFLNIGFKFTSAEWVLISNDDIGYEKGWLSEIMKVHNLRPDIESFSPKDPMLYMLYFDGHFIGSGDLYYENYKVTETIMGWSILIKKKALDRIVPFDEQFDMYYQDNDYAQMIKKNGIRHAIVRNALAVHRGTMRVKDKLTDEKIRKIEEDENKFRTKWDIWT